MEPSAGETRTIDAPISVPNASDHWQEIGHDIYQYFKIVMLAAI